MTNRSPSSKAMSGEELMAGAVRLEFQHDAAGGADLAQAVNQFPFAVLRGGATGEILRGAHRRCGKSEVAPLNAHIESLNILVDSGLLHGARRFAGEFRAIEVRVRGQPAGALHELAQGFARLAV